MRFGVWRLLGAFALLLLGVWLVVLPHQYGPTNTNLWAQALYVGIAAMGLNLLTGYNGQVSLGHGAFFGIGAYATALLMQQHGWQFLPTLAVSAALCFAVGVAIGFPALRLKGLYLALVTLGLAVVFPDLASHYIHVTGGTNLVSLDVEKLTPPAWVPTSVSAIGRDDQWAYYVTLVTAVVLLVAVLLIVRSRFGRALIAVRDHEAAAETVGINVSRVKVVAFGISALYAGLAGSCSVLVTTQASADKVSVFQLSIEFLVAVVIGGAATVFGPLVGAWILVFTQNFIGGTLPRWSEHGFFEHVFGNRVSKRVLVNPAAAPAVFGILLILFVYVLPDGIVGGAKRFARRFGANASKAPPTPTPLDASPRPPVTPVEA